MAGIAGLKPRAPKPEGNGKLSKEESRALDRDYRIQRNQSLQLRNHREQMLLAKARGDSAPDFVSLTLSPPTKRRG
jgi:hypothetical protein